jgi:hypothetical protein
MPKYADALRGYAHPVLKRDRFTCRFCNEAHNRRVYSVEGKTPAELLEQKKAFIMEKHTKNLSENSSGLKKET